MKRKILLAAMAASLSVISMANTAAAAENQIVLENGLQGGVYVVTSYQELEELRQKLEDMGLDISCLDIVGGKFPDSSQPDEGPGEDTPDNSQPDEGPGEDAPDNSQPDEGPGEDTPDDSQPDEGPDEDAPDNSQPDEEPGEDTPDNSQPDEEPDEDAPDNSQPDMDKPGADAPDGGGAQEPGDSDTAQEASFAYQVFLLVNEERAKAGVPALTYSEEISAAAMVRAKETEISFSHTRPNGTSFSTALTEQGITYRGSGENIAWGQRTPEEVMNGWMNSPGHRANILNEKFTSIGTAYYQNANGTGYWTQLFTY